MAIYRDWLYLLSTPLAYEFLKVSSTITYTLQGDSVNVLRIDFLMQALTCISFVYPLIKLLESGEHYGQQLKRWIFRGGTPREWCTIGIGVILLMYSG